ncbi:hypothetical protein AVEN_188810-1 [Araneus ventricosus]|uniref:Uncharacterized protein n=1 Tax=Araneus ventricosus TaxID=182803 RepID=A0A4Y2BVC2_ARAVE|nr:hypothetical protein AVEN_188810-1 [Araneus ventricosus]
MQKCSSLITQELRNGNTGQKLPQEEKETNSHLPEESVALRVLLSLNKIGVKERELRSSYLCRLHSLSAVKNGAITTGDSNILRAVL